MPTAAARCFSTHVLDVAERLCDEIGIIAGGSSPVAAAG